MSRQSFLQGLGATCKNWNWSWSFIDVTNKKIIFGAWEDLKSEDGQRVLILSDDWSRGKDNAPKLGYKQSLEHIEKILLEGYSLHTFSQTRHPKIDERETASIKSFVDELQPMYLERIDNGWYATVEEAFSYSLDLVEKYYEGQPRERLITYYERDPIARRKCIEYHGLSCKACGFNFKEVYGDLGGNYIHVHHKVKLSSIKKRYAVDPIKDLVPLCANCHSMIHIGTEMKTVEDLKKIIEVNHSRLTGFKKLNKGKKYL
ncbi:HNH endonuclease [Erwinia persicina]|uniref:HNH endonuclease n=1 Tax=Erwinia persicina TaxID=55211 RepID=UPI000788C4C9|nr:HNH endonuclease [Erwinia persicina]